MRFIRQVIMCILSLARTGEKAESYRVKKWHSFLDLKIVHLEKSI
jgi:hypothetical protein